MKGICRGKKWILVVMVGLGLFTSMSCAQPDPDEMEEKVGQLFFSLQLRAVAELNYYQGSPSSLALCVYQLTDRSAFDSLRDEPDGLAKLLACEKFDDAVVGRERVFMNPGQCRKVDFERRRGAKYVALAAGYHNGVMAGSTLLVELPAVTRRSGKKPPPLIGVLLECDRMLRDKSVK